MSGTTDITKLEQRISRIEAMLSQMTQAQGGRKEELSEATLSDSDLDGIADALDEMGKKLSDAQRAYLLGIFGVAAAHFGVGEGRESLGEDPRVVKVRNIAALDRIKLSDGFASLARVQPGRLGGMGPGPVSDSVGGGVSVVCVGVDWSKDIGKDMAGGQWRTNPAFGDRGTPGGGFTQPGGGLTQPGGGFRGMPGGFGR
ncbi:MAG TPA: hypothetical protein VGN96_02590 [Roseococcus sp.]|nr:hypothetical protein [Roseococcus sp.]